ncbi:MAG: acetoacetate decarboxylase family protein [Bacteroidota bacterium]
MIVAPAPWALTGEAFVLVYQFPKDFVNKNGFLAEYQIGNWSGGLGTVMCVNYESSNVGPYFELLFIPGTINLKKMNFEKVKSGFSISKIYVSTQDSVINGINNWGIPKELADFEWNKIDKNRTEIKVALNGIAFFSAIFKNKCFGFPINTSFIPLKIIQKIDTTIFLTKPKAKGKVSFVKIENLQIDANFFPKISDIRPILASKISNFKMIFPEAIIENTI